MSETEKALFVSFLRGAKSYFEYGIGGSTVLASQIVTDRIVAIDSDAAWIARSTETPTNGCDRTLIHCDIGPTGDWGYPLSREHEPKFPNYSRAIGAFRGADFDLCLVDGRFRVACFFHALLNLRSDAVVGIHDYRSRARYHRAEDFARIIAEADDMTFFVRRPDADTRVIEEAVRAYETNPE